MRNRNKHKGVLSVLIQPLIFLVNILLIIFVFLCSYYIRYMGEIPQVSFKPFKESFLFISLVYVLSLAVVRVYKRRFSSFWDFFKRVTIGILLGALVSFTMLYIFRLKWLHFPSGIFLLSIPIGVLFISLFNGILLNFFGKINKRVIIIGKERPDGIISHSRNVCNIHIDKIEDIIEYDNIDEIIICDNIHDDKKINLLIYLLQRLKTKVLFVPAIYSEILSDNLNGQSDRFLSTFFGKKSDLEEFLIMLIDILGSVILLVLAAVPMLIITILVKSTSKGPVLYKQERAGKNGKTFMLYKFRTMVIDAGLEPVVINDPRVTRVGRFLRSVRLDELPQLINVLKSQMSLVGPRPENLMRVERHKALQGIRLAVKPGLTGLAQIRNHYDLHPRHKIKYDYLYIQRRSVLLNIYLLLQTIPVILMKKGQ